MKIKIFLSDSGWGPLVRQSAILNELRKIYPKIQVTIQSNKHDKLIQRFFGRVKIVKSDNIIKWFNDKNGDINIKKIKNYYLSYESQSNNWLNKFEKDKDYDFFISDISPEAFELGNSLKIPTFGICHFTWDWFFSQAFPPMISNKIISKWHMYQKKASKFFFPPLTPTGCYGLYPNHFKVNFILNNHIKNREKFEIKLNQRQKFKILIIDSGDQITTNVFKNLIKKNSNIKSNLLIHQSRMGEYKNSISLKEDVFIGPVIKHVDLVIGRPGYNTVTEVLCNNKPAIFLSNKLNPETDWNTSQLYLNSLSGYISSTHLFQNFKAIVDLMKSVKSKEYKNNIKKQKFLFNGHCQISKRIKEQIK